MNEYEEMQLQLWEDLACDLMEFIEYELRLTLVKKQSIEIF